MKQWYFVIDVAKCENCNNCFLSCKDEHVENHWHGFAAPMATHGPSWISIGVNERGQYPLIDVAYLPTPCMHCDDAPCMKADRNGSLNKRADGIVILDPVKAKGQRQLVKACPYGSIVWNHEADLPQKCTFCAHLLDQGWEKTRCVQSCPTGALTIRHCEPSDMEKEVGADGLETIRPEGKTHPRVYYKNLYRFTHCFIAAAVAVKKNGLDECAAGAKVRLLDQANREIASATADAYGDFKFDHLELESGMYTVVIAVEGYPEKKLPVDLKKSINLGTLFL